MYRIDISSDFISLPSKEIKKIHKLKNFLKKLLTKLYTLDIIIHVADTAKQINKSDAEVAQW